MLSLRSYLRYSVAPVIVALLGGMATSAHADLVVPGPKPSPKIEITVRNEPGTSQLIIPVQCLAGGATKLGENSGPSRTIVSGIALSAGIALFGLVLSRRRHAAGAALLIMLAAGTMLIGSAGYLMANAAPMPPTPQPIAPAVPLARLLGPEPVEVVIGGQGDVIQLKLDRNLKIKPLQ